jgi:serine/threonine-protein kinase
MDYSTQAEAEAQALAACNARGPGCQSTIWFSNACGALAVSFDGAWGSDWGADQQAAEQKALIQCGKYSRGCSVVRWVCTTR